MRKTNVMLVISIIGGAGAELVVSSLCKSIDRDRFNVTVCHLKERGEKGDALLASGFDIVGIPRSASSRTDYLTALKLRELVRAKKIDVLHSHNIEPLFECALCKLLTPGLKLIHTYHFGNYPHLRFRYLLLEFLFSRVANLLVAVGTAQRRQIMSTYRLPQERIEVVYNGIDRHHGVLENNVVPDRPAGKLVIGSICTLIFQKGLDYLLDIARLMKDRQADVVFWIVGDGPLRKELEQRAEQMGLDDIVTFFGWIPNAAQSLLPSIDIFLQTSRWEAMSMVVLEAMAAGKPIVATDVGENRKIIEASGSGVVVMPGDVETTANQLAELARQPELRMDMGKRGEQAVARDYSIAAMTRNYEGLYDRVVVRR